MAKQVQKFLKVRALGFIDVVIPEFSEPSSTGKKWVNYGANNRYPKYLLDLLDKSPKHGEIIKQKAKYVAGKGFDFKEKNDALAKALKQVNSYGEGISEILKKVALDLEIFNGFYLQIIWGKGGTITDIFHVDYNKMRSSKDNSVFYYREYWDGSKGETKEFKAFNPEDRTGSQILFYKEYCAGVCTYPKPEYINALKYAEADALVAAHVLNNAKSGFTASKMITLTDGVPETDEEADEIEKGLNNKFTGEGGAKLIVNFTSSKDKAPVVDDLGTSDLTKENFTNVDDLIAANLFKGHQVTSPLLFGDRVEGQLGGRSEMREAYEIFKNTYINDRQQSIERVFNTLLEINGLPEGAITPVDFIGYDITEIANIAPKAYLLEKIGINPNDYPEDVQPDPNNPDPAKKKEQFSKEDDDFAIELFSQFGDAREKWFRVSSKKVQFTSDEECMKSEAQAYKNAPNEITQLESNVIGAIQKDKRATAEVIAKTLGVDAGLIKQVIADLVDKGLIKQTSETIGEDEQTVTTVTKDGSLATEEKRPLNTEVYVKYSYSGIKDNRNRPFCARLLELDRLYSRAEIEQISQRLGYSVWERRGGFYHNPNTGKTTPYCRHYWSQHIVLKKK
jgi:DNA-binding MarR family transcriptional regulator